MVILSINLQKSNYIIFSLRPQLTLLDSLPPVKLMALHYRESIYISIWVSYSSLTSPVPNAFRKKANKIIGLIYRHFYTNCSSSTLLQLYKMIICPLLKYGSVIWDPISPTLISSIESTQHRALKLVSKSWSTDYPSLLSQFCLSTLECRRKIAKVTLIFKIKLNLSRALTQLSP